MREMIWILSVILAAFCSFFLIMGMLVGTVIASLDARIGADIKIGALLSLAIWGVVTLAMWYALFQLTSMLVHRIEAARGEKKKKRPPYAYGQGPDL